MSDCTAFSIRLITQSHRAEFRCLLFCLQNFLAGEFNVKYGYYYAPALEGILEQRDPSVCPMAQLPRL